MRCTFRLELESTQVLQMLGVRISHNLRSPTVNVVTMCYPRVCEKITYVFPSLSSSSFDHVHSTPIVLWWIQRACVCIAYRLRERFVAISQIRLWVDAMILPEPL